MIKRFLSRFNLRYVHSLVYMLQATEYKVGDYFSWLKRVDDFRFVEKRKKLVKTLKAKTLLVMGWLIWIVAILFSVFYSSIFGYVSTIFLIILSPYVLAYALGIIVLLGQFVQIPVENVIISQARKVLIRHKATRIAIAGSFGKTTMREIMNIVLSEGKKVAAPPHSYNTPLSIAKFVKELKGDEEILIFEFGEYYPGDIRRLCEFVKPDMGVITGINEAHLAKFETLDKTAKTIFELADFLGDKPVYVNGESENARAHARKNHIIYDRNGVSDMQVKKAETDLSGTSFTLAINEKEWNFKSSLLGLHQIGPLTAAIAIARGNGLSLGQIQSGIAKTKPFEHRLEPIYGEDGVTILDDSYNGNPDGVKAVIEFLSSLKTGGRRIYVTPGLVEMGARTKEVHREIGRELAKARIEKVVLIKNSVTSYIEEGLKESQYEGEVIWFSDALSAFAALPQMTAKGDIVLLQNDWPDQYA
ncbi:MAG: UDP-N-acetylmuramoyl-tripeptide--D-alanyl-D-alanine ligase [Parcubacteria group bacterium]